MSKTSFREAPASAGGVASPCINVCHMNDQLGLCEGCRRTLDEIARWSSFSNEEKRAVLTLVAERRARHG
ncbi:MAG TPA: DUF1289 domain-containing protein [Burkholderiales bacterium]|nr:DUF1289 domain-containing protein [Burkholderiales bacterium]